MPSTQPTPDTSLSGKIKQQISEDYTYNSDGQRVNKHEHMKQQIRNAKKITGQTTDYKKLKTDMDKEVNQESQDFYDAREKRRAMQEKALGKLSDRIKKETPKRLQKPKHQVWDASPRDKISQRIVKGGF